MKRAVRVSFLSASVASLAIVMTSGVLAQNQPAQPSAGGGSADPAAVAVEGCIVREADVSARRPPEDLRSRVVQADNYVLTSTKVVTGETPAGAPGPLLYMIRGLKKGDLAKLVGQRVQIEGRFDKVGRAKNPVMFAYDLVELRGTAVKKIDGECPAP